MGRRSDHTQREFCRARTTFERSTAGAAYADSHCQARMHNIISESFKIQTTNNKRVAAAGGEGLVRPRAASTLHRVDRRSSESQNLTYDVVPKITRRVI